MEAKVSEILENILGLLALEGSFEVTEGPEEIAVLIETETPGRLIGFHGETLDALQLLVNQILNRQSDEFKRVVIDVGGWRKSKEADLERRARNWAEEVVESGQEIELEPMPSWQRRIVHMVVGEIEGVESESMGEGRDRHLVLSPVAKGAKKKKETAEESETAEKPEIAKPVKKAAKKTVKIKAEKAEPIKEVLSDASTE